MQAVRRRMEHLKSQKVVLDQKLQYQQSTECILPASHALYPTEVNVSVVFKPGTYTRMQATAVSATMLKFKNQFLQKVLLEYKL